MRRFLAFKKKKKENLTILGISKTKGSGNEGQPRP